jgi:hypothetical protein
MRRWTTYKRNHTDRRSAAQQYVRRLARIDRLALAQRFVPFGQRVLPWLPERLAQRALSATLQRWTELWGLSGESVRVTSTKRAFEMAFPEEDADRFVDEWMAARSDALAASLVYLSRWRTGRESRIIRLRPTFRLPAGKPCVVALVHFSIDPVVNVAFFETFGASTFRWVSYPLLPTVEDDRELWMANSEVPPHIANVLLPITNARWAIDAVAHLKRGGNIMLALDAPFDSGRPASTEIEVANARVPLAPSTELFARLPDVQLVFGWAERVGKSSWELDLKPVDDINALAQTAAEWIAANRMDWAGWPYIVWRENVLAMRRHMHEDPPELRVTGLRARRDEVVR